MKFATSLVVGALVMLSGLSATPFKAVATEKTNAQMALAVQENKVASARVLLETYGASANQLNPYGSKSFTLLMQAAFNGCLDMVKLLVEYGADTTIKEKVSGATALEFAFKYKHERVVAYLALVQLWDAIEANNRTLVRVMLEKFGADANGYRPYPQQKYAITPVMKAAAKGYLAVVKVLVEYGADLYQDDGVYGTAFDYALGYKQRDVINYLAPLLLADAVANNDLDWAKKIIQKAAPDLNKKGLYPQEKSATLLMKAAENGYLAMVKLLVSSGARTSIEDAAGKRAIEYAFIAKHREVVSYLATVTKSPEPIALSAAAGSFMQ